MMNNLAGISVGFKIPKVGPLPFPSGCFPHALHTVDDPPCEQSAERAGDQGGRVEECDPLGQLRGLDRRHSRFRFTFMSETDLVPA